ncbi:MAG: peptidase [Flavobacteriales bacterium]|nr:peptidase [Bacteroidota bacterium]MCB9240550.1 peptidase [Flavobacteriales bacterium]
MKYRKVVNGFWSWMMIILFGVMGGITSCTTDNDVIDNSLDNKSLGVSASGLLSSERFNKLVLEVMYMKGFAPEQSTVDSLLSMLDSLIDKPNGIQLIWTEVESPGFRSYTLNDIKVMESNNRTQFSSGSTIAVSAFFVDGDYAGNTQNGVVLGLAYANTSFVMFEKTIHEITDQILEPDRELMEQTVINHEFGHLLGLVNVGSPMQKMHQDEAHEGHCNNENCLMYYTAETGTIADKLLGLSKAPFFDQNCLNDLKANGGK